MCVSQVNREEFAVIAMEQRLTEMEQEEQQLRRDFIALNNIAATGNTAAQNDLPEARRNMQQHDMSKKSLDGQLRLIKAQVEQNGHRRLEVKNLSLNLKEFICPLVLLTTLVYAYFLSIYFTRVYVLTP